MALLVWMGLLFLVSSALLAPQMSSTGTKVVFGSLNFILRKFAHLAEYGVLVYLWLRSTWTEPERFRICLNRSVALSVLYGVTDEVHQSFVPQRQGIWYDVVLDGIGALAMGYILWRIQQQGGDAVQRWVLGPAGEGLAPDRSAAIK